MNTTPDVQTPNEMPFNGITLMFILVPIFLVALFIGAAWYARHKENKIINGDHPEDAYYTIGNISVRKSTVHIAAGAYLMNGAAHGVGNALHEAGAHIPNSPEITEGLYGIRNDENGYPL